MEFDRPRLPVGNGNHLGVGEALEDFLRTPIVGFRFAALFDLHRAPIFLNLDAAAFRHLADSRRKIDVVGEHHEFEDVTSSPAAEAVEGFLLGVDVKRRCTLGMERAAALKRFPGAPKIVPVTGNHPNNVGAFADGVNIRFGKQNRPLWHSYRKSVSLLAATPRLSITTSRAVRRSER